MKRSIAFLLLAFAAASAQAGSFGGPPPFTNGSPLQSGVNGAYQASARGSNLSGIITFAYSGGVQTTTASQNKWVIFYQGEIFAGFTDAAINDGNISGVLETSALGPKTRTTSGNTTTSSNSTDSLSIVVVAPGTPAFTSNSSGTSSSTSTSSTSNTLAALANPSGYFDAKLNNNSPTVSFKGSGVLSGVFTNTNVNSSSSSSNTTSSSDSSLTGVTIQSGPTATSSSSTTTGVTTPTIDASFKVKGVRANTGT